jgi:hypothetical protein
MPINALYYNTKFLQLKQQNSDMLRHFVGHPQEV